MRLVVRRFHQSIAVIRGHFHQPRIPLFPFEKIKAQQRYCPRQASDIDCLKVATNLRDWRLWGRLAGALNVYCTQSIIDPTNTAWSVLGSGLKSMGKFPHFSQLAPQTTHR